LPDPVGRVARDEDFEEAAAERADSRWFRAGYPVLVLLGVSRDGTDDPDVCHTWAERLGIVF